MMELYDVHCRLVHLQIDLLRLQAEYERTTARMTAITAEQCGIAVQINDQRTKMNEMIHTEALTWFNFETSQNKPFEGTLDTTEVKSNG